MELIEESLKDKVILGICAHPDDLDFGCSGTVAKWVKKGATAYYLILTDGTKGSEDMSLTSDQLKEIRRKEQKAAGKVIGLTDIFFLDHVDGELMNTPEIRKEVVKVIRKLKPDIVFTQDPSFIYDSERGYINHPDHRCAGQIALDSIFPFARNSRTFPELLEEDLTSHKVKEVFLTSFQKANFFVDITETIETKLDALAEHKSQQENPSDTRAFVKERAKMIGKNIEAEYAEGFVRIKIER